MTAPADWVVVSNAAETSVDASDAVPGGRRHRFARTPRFSTYVLAMCAGPYQVWTDEKARIPSRILARRSMAPYVDHAEIFELTRQGFDFFEPYFDIAYPYGKYDQVFVPDYNAGAMENVACVVHSDRLLFRHAATEREKRNRAITVLHEMAHMWFGDLVTMEWWDDLWLNESFATYMSMLALVRATRFKDGFESFRQDDKPWAYRQDELPTTHPIATEVADTVNAFTNFDGITYAQGRVEPEAAVLLRRRGRVPDRRVDLPEGATRTGTPAARDFLAAIGKAAGKDLGALGERLAQDLGRQRHPAVGLDRERRDPRGRADPDRGQRRPPAAPPPPEGGRVREGEGRACPSSRRWPTSRSTARPRASTGWSASRTPCSSSSTTTTTRTRRRTSTRRRSSTRRRTSRSSPARSCVPRCGRRSG